MQEEAGRLDQPADVAAELPSRVRDGVDDPSGEVRRVENALPSVATPFSSITTQSVQVPPMSTPTEKVMASLPSPTAPATWASA